MLGLTSFLRLLSLLWLLLFFCSMTSIMAQSVTSDKAAIPAPATSAPDAATEPAASDPAAVAATETFLGYPDEGRCPGL